MKRSVDKWLEIIFIKIFERNNELRSNIIPWLSSTAATQQYSIVLVTAPPYTNQSFFFF